LSKIHQAESLADEIVTQGPQNLGVGLLEASVLVACLYRRIGSDCLEFLAADPGSKYYSLFQFAAFGPVLAEAAGLA
jgi:hypothetical protein